MIRTAGVIHSAVFRSDANDGRISECLPLIDAFNGLDLQKNAAIVYVLMFHVHAHILCDTYCRNGRHNAINVALEIVADTAHERLDGNGPFV